jgi:hypothetical protein
LELNVSVKGIVSIIQHFQAEETITLGKTELYFRIEETYVSARRILMEN